MDLLDLHSGEHLWRQGKLGADYGEHADGYAQPVLHEGVVYVQFSDGLVAFAAGD